MSILRVHALPESPSLGDPDGHFWSKCSVIFLADPNISDPEFRVLQAIVTLSGPTGNCQESNEVIGRACGKPSRTVEALIRRLDRKGILSREPNGPWRKIRANFAFRGRPSDPRKVEGVKPEITPANLRDNPREVADQPPQTCGSTPATLRAILRFEDSKADLRLDRESASAGRGQGPPPPPPVVPAREEVKATAADLLSPQDLAKAKFVLAYKRTPALERLVARLSLNMHQMAVDAGLGQVIETTGELMVAQPSDPTPTAKVEAGSVGSSIVATGVEKARRSPVESRTPDLSGVPLDTL